MREIWLYALPLALVACIPASAGAAGRVNDSGGVFATPRHEATGYGYGTYIYADVLKPHRHERSEAAEQATTVLCDRGDSEMIGLAPFNACMRAHGWRFAKFVPTPPAAEVSSDSSWTPPPPDNSGVDAANAAIDAANQQRASDAANAAAQQQFIDGMAAAQQQMNNANFSQQ
jgi:hypothetical protein